GVVLGDADLAVAGTGLAGLQSVKLPNIGQASVPQLIGVPDGDTRPEAGPPDRTAETRHIVVVTQRCPAACTLLSCLVAGVRGPRRCLPLEAALSESFLLGAPGAEKEVLRVGREEGFENFLGVGTEEDDPFTVRTTLVIVVLSLVAPRPVLP